MPDLTIVYYTAGTLREPLYSGVQQQLLVAAGDIPILSVTQSPLDFGTNLCVGKIGRSYLNIYRQMLAGAKAAQTPFVAFAEDDTLYSSEHFRAFRPQPDEFAYDMSRWSFFTWSRPPIYSLKERRSNSTLIAPTALFVEAMEERFAKYPDELTAPLKWWGEPGRYEKWLKVTVRKTVQFEALVPCVTFSHPDAIGYGFLGRKKLPGVLQAYDIPYWGKARDVMARFWGKSDA